LKAQRAIIDEEIGLNPRWESSDGKHWIAVDRQFQTVLARNAWPEIHTYLANAMNRFVNSFRHRLVAWEKGQSGSVVA
jgi:hypothetical protein